MRKLMFALLFLGCSHTYAQGLMGDPDIIYMDQPNQKANLYSINPEQKNHHFEYQLPNDGVLKIDFLRLSDWGDKNNLQEITSLAAQQVQALKDSFKNDYSQKTLEMNIPINNKVISLNYREDNTYKNQMAFKDGTYYQLKTSLDTIYIVKNVSIRTKPVIDSGLVQVQYTFILKDLKDIAAIKNDGQTMERIGAMTDSVIAGRRRAWSRQDASAHQLTINVDANNNDSMSVKKYNEESPLFGGHLGIFISFGAITYNNALSPYTEGTVAYLFPTKTKMQGFVGFNFSGFGFLSTTGKTLTTTSTLYTSYNAEFGVCKKGMGFMPQKTSVMFGVMTIKDEKALFNMGINFGINRYASVGFNLAGNLKKEDKGGRYVFGINMKFNL